jgi:DNA-directed RNA polymerase subunit RPC12/RpoP
MAVTTRRPAARPLVLLSVLVAAALATDARAQEGGETGPDRLVRLRLEWHTQQARQEAADDEARRLVPARAGAARNAPNALVLKQLAPVLGNNFQALRNAGLKLTEAARARKEEARKEWEDVYRQRIAFRDHTDRQQQVYHFNFDTGAQPGFQPEVLDAVAVGWAAVLFVVAVRLSRKVRRVELRKAERAAAAVLLFGLMSVSGCAGTAPADGRPWAAREEAKLTADAAEAKKAADAAAFAADKRWAEVLDSWAALFAAPVGVNDPLEKDVRAGETELRGLLQEASHDSRTADRLAAEAADERTKLSEDKAKLSDLTAGAKLRAVAFAAARCAFVALLFGLAVAPFWRAKRRERARVAADAKKCPQCFSEKLFVETRGAPPGFGEPEGEDEEPPRKKKYKGGKKKVEEEAPQETGYVECRSCSFRFLRSYQKVHRLCFPVVGVRGSGKTQMLATGYDRVRKRTAPTCAVVQPAPSLGDQLFETFIDEIMNQKRTLIGTAHAMPSPVIMHVRDDDPQGANTALVNLFDYSGELVNNRIDEDGLKRQAVKMDGFMLFLDPTQLYGDGAKVTLDRQIAALNEFMADMREERGIPVGQVIPVPVAVCITKFDLLLTENPIQGQSVPFIRQILREMNPPPKQTSLATIEGRSEVVEQMLELMFRGVDIRGLVESYFGPRVMFFPVSSVSLFENELGIKDLSKRTIAPFGVAEPFIWLLHMHGYEMFA